jgi:hypothetical protein
LVLAQDTVRMATTLAQGKTNVVFFNRANQLIFAQRSKEGVWSTSTLSTIAGIPALNGTPVTWTDQKDGLTYAAAPSPNGLIVMKRANNGTWSFRNVTKKTPGSVRIVSGLSVVMDKNLTVHIAGLAPDGDLVVYSQNGGTFPNGDYTFGFRNVTETDVKPAAKQMPVLNGSLSISTNALGAVQIAGLDNLGRVFFFNKPALTNSWAMTNLTRTTGAAMLTGAVTMMQTANNSVSIAGITSTGEMWSVSRGGGTAWKATNISALGNGPALMTSVSSYVNAGGVGFVAATTTDGQVLLYKMRFGAGRFTWSSAGVSDAVDDAPVFRAAGQAALAAGTISIVGVTTNNHLVRFVYSPLKLTWTSEDISEVLAA